MRYLNRAVMPNLSAPSNGCSPIRNVSGIASCPSRPAVASICSRYCSCRSPLFSRFDDLNVTSLVAWND